MGSAASNTPRLSTGKDYVPQNYDEQYRGPVTVRTALANSLNVPTVKLFDGIEPSEFHHHGRRHGYLHLQRRQHGSLWAGHGTWAASEVSLLDLATAYHTLANAGHFVEPTPILSITASDGSAHPDPAAAGQPAQAISAPTAFLVTDIISDNKARAPIFGENSRLKLSRPAAAKTGTTTDFRDNWTVGFTKYLVTGVWAGNNDGHPMRNADGITGAGPIWNSSWKLCWPTLRCSQTLGAPATRQPGTSCRQPAWPALNARVPPEIDCRKDGEYFAETWLNRMAAAGVYADSFPHRRDGARDSGTGDRADYPAGGVRLAPYERPMTRRRAAVLVLPRGIGRLAMQWQPRPGRQSLGSAARHQTRQRRGAHCAYSRHHLLRSRSPTLCQRRRNCLGQPAGRGR